jgi:hypothetical protein
LVAISDRFSGCYAMTMSIPVIANSARLIGLRDAQA